MSDRSSALRSIALALVIAQLGALAHGALARHVTSRGGAIVDACPLQHAEAWAEGAALADREDAVAHHHEAGHCAVVSFLRVLAPFAPGLELAVVQRSDRVAALPPREHRASTVVKLLRLAPKASPPAAA